MVEMAPSSIGAFRSACLRLRTAVDEVGPVVAHVGAGGPAPAPCPGSSCTCRGPRPDRQVSLGAVENLADGVRRSPLLADAGFVVRDPVAHLEHQHLLLAAVVEFEVAVSVFGVSWSSSNMKWPPMALTLVGYFTPSPQRAMSIWWMPWLPMSPLP